MKIFSIEEPIGYWRADATWLQEQLQEAGGEDITIELASPGGMVTAGIRMYNLLKNYQGNSTVVLSGVVASMATYFALAADEVVAEDNAVFAIHNPHRLIDADYRAMRKAATALESFASLMSRVYMSKTGKKETEIRAIMDVETLYFGKEIKEAGFADKIIESGKPDTRADSVAFAQLAIEEVAARMKTDEITKDDLERTAAYFKENPIKAEIKKKEPIPAVGREKIIIVEDAMDIAKLKAEHLALYDEIIQVGVDKERKRVTAHLTIGETAKATDEMIKFIKSGVSVQDDEVHAEYMAAGMKNQATADRKDDEPPEVVIEKEKGEEAHIKAFEDGLKNEIGGVQ